MRLPHRFLVRESRSTPVPLAHRGEGQPGLVRRQGAKAKVAAFRQPGHPGLLQRVLGIGQPGHHGQYRPVKLRLVQALHGGLVCCVQVLRLVHGHDDRSSRCRARQTGRRLARRPCRGPEAEHPGHIPGQRPGDIRGPGPAPLPPHAVPCRFGRKAPQTTTDRRGAAGTRDSRRLPPACGTRPSMPSFPCRGKRESLRYRRSHLPARDRQFEFSRRASATNPIRSGGRRTGRAADHGSRQNPITHRDFRFVP